MVDDVLSANPCFDAIYIVEEAQTRACPFVEVSSKTKYLLCDFASLEYAVRKQDCCVISRKLACIVHFYVVYFVKYTNNVR